MYRIGIKLLLSAGISCALLFAMPAYADILSEEARIAANINGLVKLAEMTDEG